MAGAFVFTIVLGPVKPYTVYKKTHEVTEKKIDFLHIKGNLLPSDFIQPDQYFQKAMVVFLSNSQESGCHLHFFKGAKDEFNFFWEGTFETMENNFNDPKDVTGVAYALYQTQDGRFHHAAVDKGGCSSASQLKSTALQRESILDIFREFHQEKLDIASVIRKHFSDSPE